MYGKFFFILFSIPLQQEQGESEGGERTEVERKKRLMSSINLKKKKGTKNDFE